MKLWIPVSALALVAACGTDQKPADTTPTVATSTASPPSEVASAAATASAQATQPSAAMPSKCAKTALGKVKHQPAGGEAVPLEAASFTFARARQSEAKDKKKLSIYIATTDWPLDKLGSAPTVAKGDGEAYVTLTIRADAIGAGDYAHTQKLGSPLSADLHAKGTAHGLALGAGSHVELTVVGDGWVCGTVDVKGIFDGEKTHITGSFAATMK